MDTVNTKGGQIAQVFGINVHRPDPRSPLLKLVADAGIKWVRLDFGWDFIEPDGPAPNKRSLDTLHDMVHSARALGLSVFATLAYTPAWANGGQQHNKYPPKKAQEWHDFVVRTVREFQNDIQYWGMWNEPNLEQFWPKPDVAKYVDLILKPGSAAVKEVNQNFKVAAPDIACTVEGQWWEWVKQLGALRADAHFDIFAFHVYEDAGHEATIRRIETDEPWAEEADKLADRWRSWAWILPWARKLITRAGQGKCVRTRLNEAGIVRPLWLTEVGWETGPRGQASDSNKEEDQARYYDGLCRAVVTRSDWFGKVFFYELLEGADGGHKGIIRNDGKYTPKPAYYAYRDVTKEFVAGGVA